MSGARRALSELRGDLDAWNRRAWADAIAEAAADERRHALDAEQRLAPAPGSTQPHEHPQPALDPKEDDQ